VSGEPAVQASLERGDEQHQQDHGDPDACRTRLEAMFGTPLSEPAAIHHSTNTRAPTMEPPIASGLHQLVALYRPQAAPA